MPYAVYVFDAYGTLFDVHAAVRKHADTIGPDGARLSEIWRAKQLEYSWVRALMGRYQDFWTLTEQALDHAFACVPSADPKYRAALLDAYRELDCYPEVPAVLRTLKEHGARIAILSNGSPTMLDSAVRSAKIDTLLDAVLSVDELQTYKTAEPVYEMATTSSHFVSILKPVGCRRRNSLWFPYSVGQPYRPARRISGFKPVRSAGYAGWSSSPGVNPSTSAVTLHCRYHSHRQSKLVWVELQCQYFY